MSMNLDRITKLKFPLSLVVMIKLARLRDNNGLPIDYLTDWQIEEIAKTLSYGETLWNWGRGFSKTLLCTVLSVFTAIFGLKVLYLVPSKKQLDQPKAYFEQFPYIDKKGRDKKESDGWYYIDGEPVSYTHLRAHET